MHRPLRFQDWSVLSFLAIAASSIAAPPSIDYTEAIAVGRQSMQAMLDRSHTPGVAIAVSIDAELVWSDAFGTADLDNDTSVTPHTRFGIGSITKSLTMALAGRLLDEGKLDLDAPIETYLPDFHHKGKGITVRLIAAHLSGLDDAFSAARWTSDEHFATTSEAMRHIEQEQLLQAPGAKHFYATGAYTIIAGVIEAVTGTDFITAMDAYVLRPLRMTATVPNDPRRTMPNRTSFYLQGDEGKPEPAPLFDPSHKMAGAGYLSTTEDLLRFADALMNAGFLNQSTREALFTSQKTNDGTDTGFGLGWRIDTDEEIGRLLHQPGGGPGISAWLFIMPDQKMTAVILSNMTGAPVGGAEFDATVRAFVRARQMKMAGSSLRESGVRRR